MDIFQGMEIFARVVETGSFTRAAAALKLSKSRVSEAVRELETRLGTRLLDRTTRALAPTEAGRAFYARALRALEEAHAAHAEVQGFQSEPAGHLRVGAPESFADLRIVPALAGFYARYPKISIELVEEPEYVSLVEEGLDLAIRIAPEPAPNLVVRQIGASRVIVVAAPEYLKRAGAPKTPGAIAGHDLIAFGLHRWRAEWSFARGARRIAVAVAPRLIASSGATMRAAALAGLGLAALPDWMVERELRAGRLAPVLADWKCAESGIYAVYPTNRLTSPKAKLFVDHLAKWLKAKPAA